MADLNNGTYWSEVDASNNTASPNGWPEGMMPSGVNDSARSDKGALKRFWDRINPIVSISAPSGGVWTYTTSNPTYPAAYVDGEIFVFTAGAQSGGGDLFRINTLPGKPIYVERQGLPVLIGAGDIMTYRASAVTHINSLNAGAGGFLLLNPKSPIWNTGDGTATIGTSLAISGNLSVTGTVAAASALTIQGRYVLGADAGNTTIFDATVNPTLLLGTTSNLYRQTNHTFQNRDGSVNFLGITGSGTTAYGTLSATGEIAVGGNGIQYTARGPNKISFGWSPLTAYVDGTNVGQILTSNTLLGNITVGGSLTVGSTGITYSSYEGHAIAFGWNGSSFIAHVDGGPGVSLISANNLLGNITVGGTLTAASGIFGSNLSVGGTGITYTGLPLGHAIGFGWNGAVVTAYVDGTNQGNLMTNGGGTIVGSLTVNGPVTMTVGGTALNLSGGGDLVVTGQAYKTGGGAWQSISDVRTKDADTVADYTHGLAELIRLRPISYQYNGRGGTPRDGRTFVGLVADDVLPVMPELVGRMEERLDPDDDEPTDILTLDATALTFALLNAVRELAAEIDTLKRTSHAAD